MRTLGRGTPGGRAAVALWVVCLYALGIGCTQAAPTGRGDWKLILVNAAAGARYRTPSSTFRIRIPATAPAAVLGQLRLELDGIDVTALVTRSGEYAVYTPPQPLAVGPHTLRAVQETPEGELIERGVWRFEVGETEHFREAQWHGGADLTAAYRLADQGLNNTPARFQGNGSARLGGNLAAGDWRLAGKGSLVSDSRGVTDGRRVDLRGYQVNGSMGPLSARAGDQTMWGDNLALQQFDRRGISATYGNSGDRGPAGTAVTAFLVSGSAVQGFGNGLGIRDPDNRLEGVVGRVRPVRLGTGALFLSATYLRGRRSETGAGSVGSSDVSSGDIWDVRADSLWFAQRLRVLGELTESNYDPDADGPVGSRRGHAYDLLGHYQILRGREVSGKPLTWGAGLRYQEYSTFFRSQANAAAPRDLRMLTGTTNLAWGPTSATGTFGWSEDNVDGLALLPRARARVFDIKLGYAPQPAYDATTGSAAYPWYGLPNWSLEWYRQATLTLEQPSSTLTAPIDSFKRVIDANVHFYYPLLDWGIRHTITWQYDHTGATGNQRIDYTKLDVNLPLFAQRVTLTPFFEYTRTEERTGTGLTLERHSGVTLVANPTGRFSLQVDLDIDDLNPAPGGADTRTYSVTNRLTWTESTPRGARPGLTWTLTGSWNRNDVATGYLVEPDTYQVFLNLTLNWKRS